jgi:hypothetical protein
MKGMSAQLAHIKEAANMQVCGLAGVWYETMRGWRAGRGGEGSFTTASAHAVLAVKCLPAIAPARCCCCQY